MHINNIINSLRKNKDRNMCYLLWLKNSVNIDNTPVQGRLQAESSGRLGQPKEAYDVSWYS